MAEIVAGFVGPAIEVVKWVGAPIKRQFNYLCCFSSNINGLKDEARKLDDEAGELQGRVDRARDNLQDIVPKVETWLENSQHIKDQTDKILDQVPNIESGCLKLRARFSLSKRAKKTTDYMKKLRGECNFDPISQPGLPASMKAVPLGMICEFESRKKIEEDIMTTLKSGDMKMIGICGMGGLGKTTMAKRIINRVLKEHIFQEAVMAVVSQQVDKSKIQLEISGQLGLNLKEETSEDARGRKLRDRLSGTKRILLVLDDVWQKLELEDLGIPRDSKGCTILLTSRNSDALGATGCSVRNIFGMEILSEEDAWVLFIERAGTCEDDAKSKSIDTKLEAIAKKVVKECRGLPIALTTVGLALKNENNASIWNNALRRLILHNPNIPDYIAQVYNPLKLSYDFLSLKEDRSLFLLCCLFPEDADIPLEYLTYFCMGLRILEGIRNLKDAMEDVFTSTDRLKRQSLLLDSEERDAVRMHDVVRDVCIFIAKQEGYIGGNDRTWISSFELLEETSELPTGLGFPNLRLLFLSGNYLEEEDLIKFDSAFVEGLRDLYVLCVLNYYSLTSLPHTIQSLTNLNTLILDSCWELETISVVGELVNLEILICRRCYSIEELPPEIKGLNRLKLLELTECGMLQSIGGGIISSLVGLEELKILDSFKKWDREERENAGLRELEALTNLRCLEIDIEDPTLASQNMQLNSSKMERFHIRIPAGSVDFPEGFNKKLSLELEGETCLGDWIEMQLLRDTECLYLSGNGANNVDLAKCQNIRWLRLGKCESMKNIVRTSSHGAPVTVFPSIEYLDLFSLPKIQEISDGPISSTSFQNLKELRLNSLEALRQLWKRSSQNNYVTPLFTNLSSINIRDCPRLRNLGQLSTAAGNDCLPKLQDLRIEDCKMMEQVFLWNDSESPNRRIKFPQLENVRLVLLPKLATLYQGIEFPLVTTLRIEECLKMKSSSSAAIDDDDYSHLFCQPQKVSFGKLKELVIDGNPFCGHEIPLSLFNGLEVLTISNYHGSMSLFTSSVAGNLVNLRVLDITNCSGMVRVIEDEEEKVVSGGETTLLFPNMQQLWLTALRKLVSFCEWKCDVELPSLREVKIYRCRKMKSFSLGPLTTPNLEYVQIDYEYIGGIDDLNGALQQHL